MLNTRLRQETRQSHTQAERRGIMGRLMSRSVEAFAANTRLFAALEQQAKAG